MIAIKNSAAALLACLCTLVPISVSLAAPIGGSDGGGGYQYPNAKLLLKIVSEPLAKSIEAMDDKAFQNFPPNLRRVEMARIIRSVVSLPEVQRERPNANGEPEGLMFDYDRNYCDQSGCSPRILALKPFFDAYKGLPVKQLERKPGMYDKPVSKPDLYAATLADVRQRLIHETAHLLGIGITPTTDDDADLFSERLTSVMNSQYVVCENPIWRDLDNQTYMDAFLIHLPSGTRGSTFTIKQPSYSESQNQAGIDYVTKAVRVASKSPFTELYGFNSNDGSNDIPIKALSSATPGKYSIKDNVLHWETKPAEDIGGAKLTIEIDLLHGRGDVVMPNYNAFYKGGKVTYWNWEYACRIESPVISLKF